MRPGTPTPARLTFTPNPCRQVDLWRVVEEMLELCSPLAQKGVELVSRVAAVPVIIGDHDRIVQVGPLVCLLFSSLI